MPIFEYTCQHCGNTEDKIRKYEDRDIGVVCPNCGDIMRYQDKIHAAGFKLKGTGWYETDFKNKT